MADMNALRLREIRKNSLIWDSDFFTEYVRKNQFASIHENHTKGSMAIQVRRGPDQGSQAIPGCSPLPAA